jgi:Mn-dependent DtxR family transcriptional regulator
MKYTLVILHLIAAVTLKKGSDLMKRNKHNQSREDYLETIFLLGRDGKPVHIVDIARAMDYSPVSVGNAVTRLVKDSVIRMDNMKHIFLTEKGYECAVKTYEKHVFFMNLLIGMGVEREEADEEACYIEHNVSDRIFELFKEALSKRPCGRLGFCPGIHMERPDYAVEEKSAKKPSAKTLARNNA